MSAGGPLSAEIAAAELRVLERRRFLRERGKAVAAVAHRRLASPVALLSAAAAGWVLGSKSGRGGLLKAFSVLQLALSALSAIKA
jgi:hypothetical protein